MSISAEDLELLLNPPMAKPEQITSQELEELMGTPPFPLTGNDEQPIPLTQGQVGGGGIFANMPTGAYVPLLPSAVQAVKPDYAQRLSTEERELAKTGVDVVTGAPEGAVGGFRQGVAANESFAMNALSEDLTNYYRTQQAEGGLGIAPDDFIKVRRGKTDVEFFNPQSNRWTTIEGAKKDLSFNKLKELWGKYGPEGTAIATGIQGALIGSPAGPLGSTIGGFGGTMFGAFATEAMHEWMGHKLGVNDRTFEESLGHVLKFTGVEALFDLFGSGAAKAYQLVSKLWRVRPLKFSDAEELVKELESLADEAANINKRLAQSRGEDAAKFQPDVANRLQDPDLGRDLDAATRENFVLQRERRKVEVENDNAIRQFAEDYIKQSGNSDPGRAAAQLKNEAQKEIDSRVLAKSDELDNVVGTARMRFNEEVPPYSRDAAGREVSERVRNEYNRLDRVEAESWLKADEAVGLDRVSQTSEIEIPVSDEMVNFIKQMDIGERESLHEAERALARNSRIDDKLREQAGDPAGVMGKQGEEEGFSLLDGTIAFTPLSDLMRGATGTINYAHVARSLKAARSLQRAALDNQAGVGLDSAALVEYQKILTRMRDQYFLDNDPHSLALILDAERNTRRKYDVLANDTLNSMLVRDGAGRPKVDNIAAFDALFNPGNAKALSELSNIARRDPEAMLAMQRALWVKYRREVYNVKTGTLNPDSHAKFIDKYGEQADGSDNLLGMFFGKEDYRKLSRFGNFQEIILSKTKKLDRLKTILNSPQSALGKITTTSNPANITKQLLTSELKGGKHAYTLGQIKEIKKLAFDTGMLTRVNRNGQVYVEGPLADAMRARIYDMITSSNQISLQLLNQHILKNQGPVIRELLGDNYLRDLKLLGEGLMLSGKIPGGQGAQVQGLSKSLVAATRIYTRALSRPGLALTAVKVFRQEGFDEMMFNLLTKPENLRKYLKLRNLPLRDNRVGQFLALVGFNGMRDEIMLKEAEALSESYFQTEEPKQ